MIGLTAKMIHGLPLVTEINESFLVRETKQFALQSVLHLLLVTLCHGALLCEAVKVLLHYLAEHSQADKTPVRAFMVLSRQHEGRPVSCGTCTGSPATHSAGVDNT